MKYEIWTCNKFGQPYKMVGKYKKEPTAELVQRKTGYHGGFIRRIDNNKEQWNWGHGYFDRPEDAINALKLGF